MSQLPSCSLADCDVEVYYIRMAGESECWLERLLPQLTDAERERAGRFARARDGLAFAAGRALVRRELSRYAATPPGGWQLVCNFYGKPDLPRGGGAPPLRFNISHCDGLVAAAFGVSREIGLDVESVDRAGAALDVARSYFADEESHFIDSLPEERRQAAFCSIWTLKEAYIKARGMGLSIPLADFAFALDPIRITFSPRIADRAENWFFRQARLTPSHVMAVAVGRKPGEELTLRIREIPLESLPHSPSAGV